jgi:hypothetical protein
VHYRQDAAPCARSKSDKPESDQPRRHGIGEYRLLASFSPDRNIPAFVVEHRLQGYWWRRWWHASGPDSNDSEAMTLLTRLKLSERRGAPLRTTNENIKHQIFIRRSPTEI